MTEIYSRLLKPQAKKSDINCLFQGSNKMTEIGFEQRPYQLLAPSKKYS